MSDKICNICGATGLNWDQEFRLKTGRWKLMDHKNPKSGAKCSKVSSIGQFWGDMKKCQYCPFKYNKVKNEIYISHLRSFHPNGEVYEKVPGDPSWSFKPIEIRGRPVEIEHLPLYEYQLMFKY